MGGRPTFAARRELGWNVLLVLLVFSASFFVRVAWGQTSAGILPQIPVSFVNPPPSPITASSFFFAAANVDPSAVKRAGFTVRNVRQAWEYPADFVADLSLYKFYWDIAGFVPDAYVVTFWIETTDGRHGMAETFSAIADSTSAVEDTPLTNQPPSDGGTTTSGGTPTADAGSTAGGVVSPPQLQIVAPSDGTQVTSSVSLTADSNVAFESVTFFLDNPLTTVNPDLTFSAVPKDTGRLRWEFTVAANALPVGAYTVGAGGLASGVTVRSVNSRTFTVVAPASGPLTPLQVSFRNPPASPVDSPKYLFVQTNAAFSQIRQVTLRVSSGTTTRVVPGTALPELELYQFYWNVGEYSDGSYLLNAEVETTDGRRARGELYLIVSHTAATPPPDSAEPAAVQFALIEPPLPYVRSGQRIAVRTVPAVSQLSFRYRGLAENPSGTLPAQLQSDGLWEGTWPTSNLPAGDYVLSAVATVAGTPVESSRWPVKVVAGSPLPSMVVTAPVANTVLTGRVEFRGYVTAHVPRDVRLWLQGTAKSYAVGSAEVSADGQWALVWDSDSAADGTYELRGFSQIEDDSGASSVPVPVRVANAGETTVVPAPAAENHAPRVSAGSDRRVTSRSMTLHGSAEDDGLPIPPGRLQIGWVLVSGPGVVVFEHPKLATTEVVFPHAGTYRLRITAYDGQQQSSDEVSVTVNESTEIPPASPRSATPPLEPPAIVAPPQSPTALEEPKPILLQPNVLPAVDPWCRDQGISTTDACEQALGEAREGLPEDCVAYRVLHPEACRRFLFTRQHDERAVARLAPECEEQHLDGAACEGLLRRKFLPAECHGAGLNDPAACQRYMMARTLPDACRLAGVADPKGCEELLLLHYVAPVCKAAGITEPSACTEHLKSQLRQTVTCNDRQADCSAAVTRHLPTLAFERQQLDDLEVVVGSSVNTSVVLQPSSQVRPEATVPDRIEQVVPMLVSAPLSVRVLPSQSGVVITLDDTISVAAPAVVVFDADSDGISDDVEERLGTDPHLADSDGDGYPDGQELRTGHNPLGLGAPTIPLAPVDRALTAGSVLEQPMVLPASTVGLTVEKVESAVPPTAEPDQKVALQITGRGVPGQVITLFIYSQLPLVVTTRVNEDGNWTYTLQQTLLDGAHEVYLTVNDETGKAVSRSAPLKFFIREARAASPAEVFLLAPPPSPAFSRARIYLPIAGLVVSLGAFLFLAVWSAHRKRAA